MCGYNTSEIDIVTISLSRGRDILVQIGAYQTGGNWNIASEDPSPEAIPLEMVAPGRDHQIQNPQRYTYSSNRLYIYTTTTTANTSSMIERALCLPSPSSFCSSVYGSIPLVPPATIALVHSVAKRERLAWRSCLLSYTNLIIKHSVL